jgi:hypothetical protein
MIAVNKFSFKQWVHVMVMYNNEVVVLSLNITIHLQMMWTTT